MKKRINFNISKLANSFQNKKQKPKLNFLLCLILFIPIIFLSVNCGKKAKTDVTFRPNTAPVIFRCSRQNDGLWNVGGGVITPVGIFSLEQTFDMRDEYTYLVLRNREKGTDQVFKLGVKGYIEIHTQGEHKLRLQRDENKVVVDVETISGTFEVNVYPDSQAIARIELGNGQPDLVLYTDKRLAIEYDSVFWNDDSLPLDSIQSITYQKDLYSRSYIFNWKNDVKNQTQPFVLKLNDFKTSDKNFLALRNIIGENTSHIQFEAKIDRATTVLLLIISLFCGLLILASILMQVIGFSGGGKLKAFLGCLFLPFVLAGFIIPIIFVMGDAEIVKSIFT